jgi:hypothetical protein
MTARTRDRLQQLTPIDVAVLQAVNRYRYLTAAQLNRLLWPDNVADQHRYAQRRLHRLAEDGYVLALAELPRPHTGSAPKVYALGRRGRRVLVDEGVDVPSYYRPTEAAEACRNAFFMPHTLAAIDVLIAVDRLRQDRPGIELTRLLLERDLRRLRLRVSVPATRDRPYRQVAVVPDAYFALAVTGTTQHFLVELDRGTERPTVWRDKVAALTSWVASPASQTLLTTEYVTVMVVTPQRRRRDHLRAWTAEEHRSRGLQAYDELYQFTDVSPVRVTPTAFFGGAYWYPPSGAEPDSLVDLPAR